MSRPPETDPTNAPTAPSVQPLGGLLDDAALFPPGNAAMAEAVSAHRRHRQSWYAAIVGNFVCTDRRLPELVSALPAGGERLELALVVPGGLSALPTAVAAATCSPRVALRAIELPAPGLGKDLAQWLLAARAATPGGVMTYVEIAFGPCLPAAVEQVAAAGLRAKFRTGGTGADAFPSESALAEAIAHAVRWSAPFKLTAGLHHAVRHTDAVTGFEHHGFLNVLATTASALDGAGVEDLSRLLACRDGRTLSARCMPARVAAARRWFTSFGTCSIDEPVDDLLSLRLVGKA